ncbi:MAG TPA: hypothetical protein DHV28_05680 [Ignavibacteriales bacterium]|nr:hypothetical protein [Ignavibacteriales bacterium]
MTIPPSVVINFEDESALISNGVIELQANSLAILANLHTAQLILNEGTTLNFNSGSKIKINENLVMSGSSLNPIIINLSTSNKVIEYEGSSDLLIQYCQFNNGGINIIPSTANEEMNITISNTNFLSQTIPISIDGSRINYSSVQIHSCYINNAALKGIYISNTELLNISNSTIIISNDVTAICIDLLNNSEVNINNCEFVNDGSGRSGTGINLYSRYLYGEQEREGQLLVQDCNFQKFDKSIFINQATESLTALSIKGSNINDCNDGIILVKVDEVRPAIKGNSITNFWRQAINVNRGDQIDIYQNILLGNPNSAQNLIGINLSQVTNPYIINNNIFGNGNTTPGSGIFEESCYGEIRKNTITGFTYGIELGGSSPRVAENEITGNITYGLYVSSDSHPDLGETQVGELKYPLTGYNNIHENGICNLLSNPEIFIIRSTIDLKKGCNTIADDREDEPQYNCDFVILMDGKESQEQVYAEKNYWGNHPVFGHNPEGRFGQGIDVIFDGYLEEPCTFSPGGGEILLLSNSLGEVYDSVYSSGVGPMQPTEFELKYALANNYFYNGELTLAKQEYEGIVQNYGDEMSSLEAYNKIYAINNILNSSPETFLELRSYYLQQISNQTDSLIMSTLTHLSNLCLVSAKEYGTAINNFDQIVQQNFNSDLALYRAIDALTTSLLTSDDSTLNKNVASKYYVSGFDDYGSKVRELLRTRKAGSIENWKENIPKEYTLYQNYPNPFNPSTTIKFDLPVDGLVQLEVYDILGRRVAALINENKAAGKYEVNFSATGVASSLASGVYIYQLKVSGYIKSKKMILLK